jgi:hypothetical protein
VSAPTAGALAVVRVELFGTEPLATLPDTRPHAEHYLEQLLEAIRAAGDSPALLAFQDGTGWPRHFRARDVIAVELVSPEGPGA